MQPPVDRHRGRSSRQRSVGRGVGLALVLLGGCVLLAGCENRTAEKPRASEAAGAATRSAGTQASGPAASLPTGPAPKLAVGDYVVDPVIDPSEKDAGPKRIISMAPCLTELCYAMGLGERLVGRTQYCVYPPAAQKVEIVGALLDPNVERILTLQPDLVLITASSSMLKERFAALKLPVLILPDSSLEDVFLAVEQLGRATQRPKSAAALVRQLRAELGQLQQASHAARARPYKVMFVTGALSNPPRSLWVAGPGSYIDTLLSLAGASNALEGDRAWLEISAEQVLWLRPEVIVEVREAPQASQRDEAVAAWRNLPGLAKVRIVTLTEIGMMFPGPRVNVMLAKLMDGLYAHGAARDAD